jgi:hypothetical protein
MNKLTDDCNVSDLRREMEALRERLEKMELKQGHPKRLSRRFRLRPAFAVFLVSAGFLLFLGALGAQSGQQDALFINQKGNVGIGTKTPGFPLTFPNALGDKISLFEQSGDHYGFGIQSATLQIHTTDKDSKIAFGYGSSGSMTETMRIQGDGNVGIGTKTPGFPLTFPNALGDKISLFGQSGDHYGFGIQSATLQIHTTDKDSDVAFGYGSSGSMTQTMRIRGDGDVVIGTTKLAAKLTVDGDIASNGNIKLGKDATEYAPASAENLRMVRGTVRRDGTRQYGSGFESVRRNQGEYRITFTTPFADVPSAVASQIADSHDSKTTDNALIDFVDTKGITVYVGGAGGGKDNREFSFIVMGPR